MQLIKKNYKMQFWDSASWRYYKNWSFSFSETITN